MYLINFFNNFFSTLLYKYFEVMYRLLCTYKKKTTYFRSNIFLGNQLNFKVNDKHFSVVNNRNMFLKPL